MSDPQVKVLPVTEGSIVWLHNVDFAPAAGDSPDDQPGLDQALDALLHAVGHNRFAVLCTNGDGIVEVLGPDDLVARVRAALDPASWPICLAEYRDDDQGIHLRCTLRQGHDDVEPLHLDTNGSRWDEGSLLIAKGVGEPAATTADALRSLACSVQSPHDGHVWTGTVANVDDVAPVFWCAGVS